MANKIEKQIARDKILQEILDKLTQLETFIKENALQPKKKRVKGE